MARSIDVAPENDEAVERSDLVRRALEELRSEIRARFPALAGGGEAAPREPGAASAEWMELFEELRARLNRLGVRERRGAIDEFGLDDEWLARVRPLLAFLFERWWRVDVRGAEQVPASGGTLLVGNHSGLLPWDGLMVAEAVARAHPARQSFKSVPE